MIKTFCDRCKKEIKEPSPTLLNHRIFYGKAWLDNVRPVHTESERYFNHLLCEECEDSFFWWFNHPEIGGGTDG